MPGTKTERKGRHRFEGHDAKECEEFIYTIRLDAFEKDKDQDDVWVARYASTFMARDALRWFEELNLVTQTSWALLRKALLKEWPSVKIESEGLRNVATTGYVASSDSGNMGRLFGSVSSPRSSSESAGSIALKGPSNKRKRGRSISPTGRKALTRLNRTRNSSPEVGVGNWTEGVIRLQLPGDRASQYLGCKPGARGEISDLSREPGKRLRVSISPEDGRGLRKMKLLVRILLNGIDRSRAHNILKNFPRVAYEWLAVSWERDREWRWGHLYIPGTQSVFTSHLLIHRECRDTAAFVGSTPAFNLSSAGHSTPLAQIRIWTLAPTGELQVKWSDKDGGKWSYDWARCLGLICVVEWDLMVNGSPWRRLEMEFRSRIKAEELAKNYYVRCHFGSSFSQFA